MLALGHSAEEEVTLSTGATARRQFDWGVYAVTDDTWADDQLVPKLEQAIRGGCTAVQLRLKHKSMTEMLQLAWPVKELCLRHGVAFIVDDRVDIALAVDADGVHVGADDVPATVARQLIGPDKILGVSTYGEQDQVVAALHPEVGADYLGSPAVYATVTKPGAPEAGLDMLRQTKAWIEAELSKQDREPGSCPLVAIGGVDASNAARCVAAGADGLASVRGLLGSTEADARANAALMRAVLPLAMTL